MFHYIIFSSISSYSVLFYTRCPHIKLHYALCLIFSYPLLISFLSSPPLSFSLFFSFLLFSSSSIFCSLHLSSSIFSTLLFFSSLNLSYLLSSSSYYNMLHSALQNAVVVCRESRREALTGLEGLAGESMRAWLICIGVHIGKYVPYMSIL